jgi:hypothetical protein
MRAELILRQAQDDARPGVWCERWILIRLAEISRALRSESEGYPALRAEDVVRMFMVTSSAVVDHRYNLTTRKQN